METYLAHHGILGMKWGIRRYQNEDGTLTEAGKKRLDSYKRKEYKKLNRVRAKALAANDVDTMKKIKDRQSTVLNVIDRDHTKNDKAIESNNKFGASVSKAYSGINASLKDLTFAQMRSEKSAVRWVTTGIAAVSGLALGIPTGILLGDAGAAVLSAGAYAVAGAIGARASGITENVRYRKRKYNQIMSEQEVL